MQFVRLVVFGFLFLSVIYICISLYSRSVRREKLEEDYDANPREGMSRETFIAEGMAAYESGFRKRLILLVYVVPTVFIGTVLYLINN